MQSGRQFETNMGRAFERITNLSLMMVGLALLPISAEGQPIERIGNWYGPLNHIDEFTDAQRTSVMLISEPVAVRSRRETGALIFECVNQRDFYVSGIWEYPVLWSEGAVDARTARIILRIDDLPTLEVVMDISRTGSSTRIPADGDTIGLASYLFGSESNDPTLIVGVETVHGWLTYRFAAKGFREAIGHVMGACEVNM